VPVIVVLAAVAILGGVMLAALGRGGEMTAFPGDYAPLDLDEVSAADVALLRPPMSLWGYNAQATEEALQVIARSVTERDVEIATLRRELAELRTWGGTAADPAAGGPHSWRAVDQTPGLREQPGLGPRLGERPGLGPQPPPDGPAAAGGGQVPGEGRAPGGGHAPGEPGIDG
jgi:hypothetical protein